MELVLLSAEYKSSFIEAVYSNGMKNTLKRLGLGTILWAVCYAAAIPLLPINAQDPMIFRSLMFVIGAVVSSVLIVYYFLGVQKDYLRESVLLGVTWLAVNWFLDIVALIPFTQQSIPQYFMQLGVEYIGMLAPILAIGYLLHKKTRVV